jgi:F-type H+-transporting ATPase subunit epsilon
MPITLNMILPDRRIELRGLLSVVFQSMDGELGILEGHAPLVCGARAGTLRATTESRHQHRYVMGEGLAHVSGDSIRLLLMDLIAEDEIDEAAARRLLQRARAEAAVSAAGDNDSEELVLFAEAQLALLGNGTF